MTYDFETGDLPIYSGGDCRARTRPRVVCCGWTGGGDHALRYTQAHTHRKYILL